jgi:hypothetical protein
VITAKVCKSNQQQEKLCIFGEKQFRIILTALINTVTPTAVDEANKR